MALDTGQVLHRSMSCNSVLSRLVVRVCADGLRLQVLIKMRTGSCSRDDSESGLCMQIEVSGIGMCS